jgi:hypothetical protein
MTIPAIPRLDLGSELLNRAQDKALPTIKALATNLLVNGRLTDEVLLQPGPNDVPHLLGRKFIGWIVVAPSTNALIYRDSMQTDDSKALTMTILVDVLTSCRFWVF